jgi:hypothetical protein
LEDDNSGYLMSVIASEAQQLDTGLSALMVDPFHQVRKGRGGILSSKMPTDKTEEKKKLVNVCASDYFSPSRGFLSLSNNNMYNTQPLFSLENLKCF